MAVMAVAQQLGFKNILVATDFSKISERALDYASSFARRYHSALNLVHVVDPALYTPLPMEYAAVLPIEEAVKSLESRLQVLAKGVGADATIYTPFEEGGIGKAVHKLATEKDIDLIVVGTHGHETLQRLMLGSKAEEIFREATCPVLTVGPEVYRRPELEIRFKHILYATDLSQQSAEAAPLAVSLAEQYRAKLTLMHVMSGDMVSQGEVERRSAHYRKELRKLASEQSELKCQLTISVHQGWPASVITQFASECSVDLIVLGAKHGSFVKSRLVSGTAYQVVCHADCPVLTIRGR